LNYYRVKADVNLDAIRANVKEIRKFKLPETKIMIVVKADAYGHGAVPIALAINDIVDAFGVAIVEEAIELRQSGINKPILVVGYTSNEQTHLAIANNVTLTVFKYESALKINEEAKKQGKIAKIHLKIDTGMSRIGFLASLDTVNEIKKISQLKNLIIEGVFSHFVAADCDDKTIANKQLNDFKKIISQLEDNNINIPIKHISNSAATLDIPSADFNMVRCGLITYGLYPSDEINKNKVKLIPAMTIKTHVIFTKEVPIDTGVSYGSTFITSRNTKIATIPVGYADGYSWSLSNKGRVIIKGQYAPVIGRICMDQFMVDITDIDDVKEGDLVTLLGTDGDACITVEELSGLSNSFVYEFICHVGKRIPRVYIG